MKLKHNRTGRKIHPVLTGFLTVVIIAVASYAAALIWQNMQESAVAAEAQEEPATPAETQQHISGSEEISAPSEVQQQPAATMPGDSQHSQPPSETSDPEPDDQPPPSAETEPGGPDRSRFSYALPASEAVDASYFDDAIFFGDSISTGIPAYNVMPNATVVAFTGIATANVMTKECIDTDSGRRTMLDAARQYGDKKKVYIMLGGNGLGYDKETFIAGYAEFINAVKIQYPDAAVYVQTMTPVTDYAYKTYPSVSNEIIEEYNLAIQDMAREKNVHFLDVASALMNEDGKLPEEASPVDGMHFTPEYYLKWFHYLKTHTAEEQQK